MRIPIIEAGLVSKNALQAGLDRLWVRADQT